MRKYIECRDCGSKNCAGCNIFILSNMLRAGKFDEIMDGNRKIKRAADVVERKRGEWSLDHDCGAVALSCSLCDEHYWMEFENDKKPNFCPNCGADMRGEKHDSSCDQTEES